MKRTFSRYDLNVFQLELEKWPYPIHTHNFYELILIEQGTGTHTLNGVSFKYHKGHVFLLTPDDTHSFDIDSFTIFTYVKFTEQLFIEKQEFRGGTTWRKKIESVLFNPNTIPECIIKNKQDKKKLFQLVGILFNEFKEGSRDSREIMLELFGAILLIVARNLSEKNILTSKVKIIEKDKVNEILTYIRQNITNKEVLTQQHIADRFHISPNYVSIFLKKHTGMGIKRMVTETRLITSERLLKQSGLTISQISNKLGFMDSSHFTKTFKKYRGTTPKTFRN